MLATCPTVERIFLPFLHGTRVLLYSWSTPSSPWETLPRHIFRPHFDKSLPLDWKAVYISTGSGRFAFDPWLWWPTIYLKHRVRTSRALYLWKLSLASRVSPRSSVTFLLFFFFYTLLHLFSFYVRFFAILFDFYCSTMRCVFVGQRLFVGFTLSTEWNRFNYY